MKTDGLPSTAERLVANLSAAARQATAADIRIGLGYTAVMLDDGRAGVAYTFRHAASGCCAVFKGVRPIAGRSAADVLAPLGSSDPIEAGVGLACANALANHAAPDELEGDVLEHLEVGSDDDVGMVGCFGPLVGELRARARSLTIFERLSEPTELLRPEHEAVTALPRCQVALITSTSIINHSVDELLAAARSCRQLVLVGASTPLLPEAFVTTNVTRLSGVVVTDAQAVLRVVSEGGGMRQFSPQVRKVTTRGRGLTARTAPC